MENLTKERQLEIENLVNSLLKQNGYDEDKDTSFDIVEFVSNLGFNIGNAKLEDNEDGLIIVRDRNYPRTDKLGDKVIAINRYRSVEAKRFIIAHEFAFYILRYKNEDFFLHDMLVNEKMKEEPDIKYFALALLMPTKSFIRTKNKLEQEGLTGNALILQLASIYNVTISDVSKRITYLKNLGDAYVN